MGLSDEERAFVNDLRRILLAPGANLQYEQLAESFEGRVLNADIAREMSREYRTKYNRLAFTTCSYPPCAEYMLRRFRQKIGEPGEVGSRTILFLAGGAASEKTSSVGENTLRTFDLVFDSNLAGFPKAQMMIEESLQAGWFVQVRYIHRPYKLAVESMIDRALDSGRYIPLGPPSKLAKLHMDAQATIWELRRHFPADYVRICAYENLWQPANRVDAKEIDLSMLDKNGRYYYKDIKELHAIEDEVIESYRADNFSEEAVFQALGQVED